METKTNIFKEHLAQWLRARGNKKKRGEIIRHICFVTGVHAKSVPRSFRRVQMRDSACEKRRGRKTVYTPDVIVALKEVWEAGAQPCGENLHPMIPEYVRILSRDKMWTHSVETTRKLLAMSCATTKRHAEAFTHIRKMARGMSATKPGNIHSLIPVRTGPWNESPAGTLQIDTVAHCGGSLLGDFIYTVNATDVATLWGARHAQWQKGQDATVTSMEAIAEDVPLHILEWHPDSGTEFVNWHCKDWCDGREELLTRSRPSHSNDNCFVEERNGHIVRKWVGYTRFDAKETVDALNAVYDVLTPYLNHFIASRRIVSKERIGARWKVTREKKSLTPYERVLLRSDVTKEVKHALREEHGKLNPLLLKQEIDRKIEWVFTVQKRHGEPNSRERFG